MEAISTTLLLSGIATGLLVTFRQSLSRAYNTLQEMFTTCLMVESNHPHYVMLLRLIDEHVSYKRSGSFQLNAADPMTHRAEVLRGPGIGVFKFNNKYFKYSLTRDKDTQDNGGSGPKATSAVDSLYKYTLRLATLPRRREVLQSLIDYAQTKYDENIGKLQLRHMVYAGFSDPTWVTARDPSTIVSSNGSLEIILKRCEEFLANREKYLRLGIQYKLVILLHGPPGNGKTTIVKCVASHLKRVLVSMRIAGSSDSYFIGVISQIKKDHLLFFDDVDQHGGGVDGKTESNYIDRISLGTLLGFFDGVSSPEGCITFLATNHREKMDPSLLRPGRVDLEIEIKDADTKSLITMFERFYGKEETAKLPLQKVLLDRVSHSLIQGVCQSTENPREAVDALYIAIEKNKIDIAERERLEAENKNKPVEEKKRNDILIDP